MKLKFRDLHLPRPLGRPVVKSDRAPQVCMRERNGRIAGTAGADEVLIAIIREVAASDGDTPVVATKLRAVHKVQNGSTSRGHLPSLTLAESP